MVFKKIIFNLSYGGVALLASIGVWFCPEFMAFLFALIICLLVKQMNKDYEQMLERNFDQVMANYINVLNKPYPIKFSKCNNDPIPGYTLIDIRPEPNPETEYMQFRDDEYFYCISRLKMRK